MIRFQTIKRPGANLQKTLVEAMRIARALRVGPEYTRLQDQKLIDEPSR